MQCSVSQGAGTCKLHFLDSLATRFCLGLSQWETLARDRSWEVSWRQDISTTLPSLWVVCLAMSLFLSNSSSLHSPGLHWGPPANFHWNRPWLLGSGNTTFELAVASFVTLSWPLVFLPFKLFPTPFKQVPCIACFLLNSFSYEFPDSEEQRLQILWYTSSKNKDIFLSTSIPLSLKKLTKNVSNIIY